MCWITLPILPAYSYQVLGLSLLSLTKLKHGLALTGFSQGQRTHREVHGPRAVQEGMLLQAGREVADLKQRAEQRESELDLLQA